MQITSIVRRLSAPALLALVCIGFFWKFIVAKQYTWIDHPDGVYQVLPWLQVQAAELHAHRFPLWDPHLGTGHPLVGQIQPATFNPVNLLFLMLPLRDGYLKLGTVNWFFVTGHFLAALACYAFLRDRRCSQLAAMFGGAAFALAGFPGSVGWPQILYSIVPLPLVAMFHLRTMGPRPCTSSALGGVMLGLAFLGGHHNIPIFAAVLFACFWGYDVISAPAASRALRLRCAALFVASAGLVASAVLVPAWEFGQYAIRWVNAPAPVGWDTQVPYTVHHQFSTEPTALLGLVIPAAFHHASPFLGWCVVALAFLGIALAGRRRSVRFCVALAALGLAFTLGSSSLFHGILYAIVPSLDKARSPAMAVAIFHLGACALAAFGIDAVARAVRNQHTRWLQLSMRSLAAFAILVFGTTAIASAIRPEHGQEYRLLILSAMGAAATAAVLAIWRARAVTSVAAAAMLGCIMLSECYNASTYGYRPVAEPYAVNKLFQHDDLAGYLRSRTDQVRVVVDDKQIPYNFGDWHGIDQIGGYVPAMIEQVVSTQHAWPIRRIMAVNYFIGNEAPDASWAQRFTGHSGISIYAAPNPLPRFRTVHRALPTSDWQEAVRLVESAAVDPIGTVTVETAVAPLETCPEDADAIVPYRYEPSRIALTVEMGCTGMLIAADTWYPGWEARIDGSPTPIYRAYGTVRTIVVPGGRHTVEFLYRPWSVYLGLAATAMGFLLALCIAWLEPAKVRAPKPTVFASEAVPLDRSIGEAWIAKSRQLR